MIYKLLRPAEWEALAASGSFAGSPDDVRDGFIHFSTAAQVKETAAKHFANAPELVLAEIDDSALGTALKWEPSRGGQLFPHLYAALPAAAVVRHWTVRGLAFPIL
ncbi:MAG: DUF952 domain-containing protein [Elusimicrobia bacterium]|nr:DUF952 domain-containing protein [Elusimicrobiota bacterium]